jgi:NADH dehydrogenase
MPKRILILGGGFAGLAAARELGRRSRSDLSVRLVDRRARSVFLPLLPDAISHRIRPRYMGPSLVQLCRRFGVDFAQRCVRHIDPDSGLVETDRGTLRADVLLICLGCETRYFGNQQAHERAIGLRSLEEARRIRTALLRLARDSHDASGSRPHMLMVGGGYTGFETAGQAAYILHRELGWPPESIPERLPIVILEKAPDVLRTCSPTVRRWAREAVRHLGVEVRTRCTVEEFTDTGAVLTDGTEVPHALVTWSPGATPGEAAAALETPRVKGGRLAVDEFLRLPERETAFAAGDVAGPAPRGDVLRMAVQFSLGAGTVAARNALRTLAGKPLRRFDPPDLGYVVPLLPGRASGVVLGKEMWGRAPSLLHYVMCSLRSWRWEDRLGVLNDFISRRTG